MAKQRIVRSTAQWDAFRTDVLNKTLKPEEDIIFCKDFGGDAQVSAIGPPGGRAVRFTISSGNVDRDGDTIDPRGWDFNDYLNNPVVLWNHQLGDPPIARTEVLSNTGGLVKAEAVFPTREMHPFGGMIYDLLVNKFIRGASVGYKALKYEPSTRGKGIDFSKQSMHEWSVVPVPCNPIGLSDAKAFGIDIEPMREWIEEQIEKFAGEPATIVGDSQMGDFLREAYVKAYGKASIIVPEIEGLEKDFVADLEADGAIVIKVGRKISKMNEAKIKEAMTVLGDILAGLTPDAAGTTPAAELPDAKPDVPGDEVVRTDSEPDKAGEEVQEDTYGTIELTDEEEMALANSRGDRNGPQLDNQSHPGDAQHIKEKRLIVKGEDVGMCPDCGEKMMKGHKCDEKMMRMKDDPEKQDEPEMAEEGSGETPEEKPEEEPAKEDMPEDMPKKDEESGEDPESDTPKEEASEGEGDDKEKKDEEMMLAVRKPPAEKVPGIRGGKAMMRECQKCGAKLSGKEKFCPECGFALAGAGPGSQRNPGVTPGVGKSMGSSIDDNDSVIIIIDEENKGFEFALSEVQLKAMLKDSLEDGLIGLTGKLPR